MPNTLTCEQLASYPLAVIAPKNHPLTQSTNISLQDLAGYGLIFPTPQFSSQHLLKMVFALNDLNYKIVLEAESWGVIKKYVSLGLGISVVIEPCLEKADLENFAILDLGNLFPNQNYGVISKTGKTLSGPAQKFIEILKSAQ